MEERKIVVQSLKIGLDDEYAIAEKYYSILSALNNLGLTKREIELVAYTAIKGTISYANTRTEFCQKYNTTPQTINNTVCRLKKIKLLVKKSGKVKVNPLIVIDFKKDLNLVVKLTHSNSDEETKRNATQRLDNKENVNKVDTTRSGHLSSSEASV
jgi:hypothetical protein